MNYPRDKTGRQIMPGDTVKVFHFTGARRKRHYMHKYVLRVEANRLCFSHLNGNPAKYGYSMPMSGQICEDYEIVQGFAGVEPGQDFSDRPTLQTTEVESR